MLTSLLLGPLLIINIISHRSRLRVRAASHPRQKGSGLLDRVEGLLARAGMSAWKAMTWWSTLGGKNRNRSATVNLERFFHEQPPFVELSELLIEVDGCISSATTSSTTGIGNRGTANSEGTSMRGRPNTDIGGEFYLPASH